MTIGYFNHFTTKKRCKTAKNDSIQFLNLFNKTTTRFPANDLMTHSTSNSIDKETINICE